MVRAQISSVYPFTQFGPQNNDKSSAKSSVDSGGTHSLIVPFDFDDLPGASTDTMIRAIPANSFIVEATIQVITAFASGTDYDVGLIQRDGTAIDVDGIDENIAVSLMNAVGETVICNGNLIGGLAGTGTADGVVIFTATGTYTAGRGILTIRYRRLSDRASKG